MGEDGACLDVSASGGKHQKALMSKCLMLMHLHMGTINYPHFIDVLNVSGNNASRVEQRSTMEMRLGSFTQLVFSTSFW